MKRNLAFIEGAQGNAAKVEPLYLRREAVAQILSVSERTLTNFQRRGILPFFRIGRTVLFKVADVSAALERYRVSAVGEPRPRKVATRVITAPVAPTTARKRRAGRITAATEG